jgi:hypothetical protein
MEAEADRRSARNDYARAAVGVGLLAVAALPVAVVAAKFLAKLTLPTAVGAAAAAGIVLGFGAISFARRARFRVELSLGRGKGARAARIGHALGLIGVCIGLTAALALGFYALLLHFEG